MKTFFKIIGFLFIGFIGLMFLFYFVGSKSSDKSQIEKNKLANKHCAVEWSTTQNKKSLLQDVIKNPDINRNGSLHVAVATMLKKTAKYPNTLKFDGDPVTSIVYLNKKYVTDIDTTAGTYVYKLPFTSENKISQTVKSQLTLLMRYNAGCNPSEIVDYHIE